MTLAAASWALFLDFDGTLVDLAERPDAIVVAPGLTETLASLSAKLDGALAIVSGRAISDIDRYLAKAGLDVCGLHGLERRVGGSLARPDGLRDLGPDIAALRHRFADRPGIVVEDKGVGVTIHWRMAPEAEAEAAAAMAELAGRLGEGYRIQDGKAVREIVPAQAGKGAGIAAMMAAAPYRGRRPIFVGDDRTDEDGFSAVSAMDGETVKVGEGPTAARRRAATPAEIRAWLTNWSDTGQIGLDSFAPR